MLYSRQIFSPGNRLKMPHRFFAKLPLERILVLASVVLGAVHAWVGRYSMNPDGVSYLDMGDALVRRDWVNALNAYWSPLYGWLLGIVVNAVKPPLNGNFPSCIWSTL